MLQILMILSTLLGKYDLELPPGQKIEPRAMVILRPKNGIRMSFTDTVPAKSPCQPAAPTSLRISRVPHISILRCGSSPA